MAARTDYAALRARVESLDPPPSVRTADFTGSKTHDTAAVTTSASQQPLYFVDEFTLLDGKLAFLLNRLLRRSRVVLVGDCNQQSAIGDCAEQSTRTLLAYETVAFMYDNVRAKDPRMLERLMHFSVRMNTVARDALRDLPNESRVDMHRYLDECAKWEGAANVDRELRWLPRVIVNSNERVNFINWAIGRLLWLRRDDTKASTRVLCYSRQLIVSSPLPNDCRRDNDVPPAKRQAVDNAHTTTSSSARVLDDTYADEHFVAVGLRYRLIRSIGGANSPLQIGARVIVSEIERDDAVLLEVESSDIERDVRDDDESSSRVRFLYRVTKQLVRPYEYNSKFNGEHRSRNTDTSSAFSFVDTPSALLAQDPRFYMFPFVLDAAISVYQVQGLTIDQRQYANCYIDVRDMDNKAFYVTLSRFENQDQICGVINVDNLR